MRVLIIYCIFFAKITLIVLSDENFCGHQTCYQILNIDRSADTKEIKKSFYKLASIYHPDINKNPEAIDTFFSLSNAYEILIKKRLEYDEYLDYLESENGQRFFKQRVYFRVDLRTVIFILVLVVSYIQYYLLKYRYEKIVEYQITLQRYRNLAYRNELLRNMEKDKRCKYKDNYTVRITDDMVRKAVEDCPEFYLVYHKPTWKDALLIQIFVVPYRWTKQLYYAISSFIKYKLLNLELENCDKINLTCKALNVKEKVFEILPQDEIDYYLSLKLWEKENCEEYYEDLKSIKRQKNAESGKAKAFKRFVRNGGFGRMTFEE